MTFYSTTPFPSVEGLKVERVASHGDDSHVYNVVFLGPTGTGKSRLINLLSGDENAAQTSIGIQSETQGLTVYPVIVNIAELGVDNFKYNLIDTQGVCDSKLPETEVLKVCSSAFNQSIRSVHTFVLVLKHGRIEAAVREALEQLIEFFDLSHPYRRCHVLIVVTKCDGLRTEALEIIRDDIGKDPTLSKLIMDMNVTFIGTDQPAVVNNVCLTGMPEMSNIDEVLQSIFQPRIAAIHKHVWRYILIDRNSVLNFDKFRASYNESPKRHCFAIGHRIGGAISNMAASNLKDVIHCFTQ